jgi:hypothetical protein
LVRLKEENEDEVASLVRLHVTPGPFLSENFESLHNDLQKQPRNPGLF